MKPKCIVLDFDNTISSFKGGKSGLFAIFTRQDADGRLVRESYEETKKEGMFSIENLTQKLEQKTGIHFNKEEITKEFQVWILDTVCLYSDSAPIISNWRKKGIPVIILTFGYSSYQKQKISMTNTPHDEVFIVESNDTKISVCEKVIKKYGKPLIVIDDTPSVLDDIKDMKFSQDEVVTFLMRRPDCPYIHNKPKYYHREISDFYEAEKIIGLL